MAMKPKYPKARLGHGDVLRHRMQAILEIIRRATAEHPMARSKIEAWLEENNLKTTARTVQRDLQLLESEGFVKRAGNGWIPGDRPHLEELDQLATSVALEVMKDAIEWAIPHEVQQDLRDVMSTAKERIKASRSQSPTRRWIEAFRFRRYTALTRPNIDADVRDTIETAILRRTKIRLNYRFVVDQEAEASISHYLLSMRGGASIVVWLDSSGEIEKQATVEPFVLPLQYVNHVELTEKAAHWPADFDVDKFLAAEDRSELRITYVIKLRSYMLDAWKRMEIGRHLDVLGIDEEGYATCRFDAGDPREILHLLDKPDTVEVLEPLDVAKYLRLSREDRYNMAWNADGTVRVWDEWASLTD